MPDFDLDLKYSLESGESEMFDKFYFRVFRNLDKVETVSDLVLQKQGIDKKLHFKNTKVVLIDEKKRRKNYGDILLEEWSNEERKIPGWLGGSKLTDYIVYATMDTKKIYLLPFLLLQKVWVKNYAELKQKFGVKRSNNSFYTTSNIAVPTDLIFFLLEQEMKEKF